MTSAAMLRFANTQLCYANTQLCYALPIHSIVILRVTMTLHVQTLLYLYATLLFQYSALRVEA